MEIKKKIRKTYWCPFCGKKKDLPEIICSCEVAPKYDVDYQEWKDK